MSNSIQYWIQLIRNLLSLDQSSMRFKKYLSQRGQIETNESDALILIEFEQSPENVLGLSIFLPTLLESMPSKPIAYHLAKYKKLRKCLKSLQFRFSTTFKLIGPSLILGDLTNTGTDEFSHHEWQTIQTPEDLETFEYAGIRIGDLIYDEYLAKSNMHTVILSDPQLREIFFNAISTLQWWVDLSNTKTINAIIVSHDVYLYGIPARLGIARDIPVFLVSTSEIIRLNKLYPRVGSDIPRYPQLFLEQDANIKSKGLIVAKSNMQNRIHGVGPSDLYYFPLVAFSGVHSQTHYLKVNGRRRILIAAHDFYDSPHGGQIHFYPDFFLWLCALSEISHSLDYDWYIKTHPYLRGRGREILTSFVSKNSNFQLLPSEVSHNQIVSEGVDLVLTVYGTIATEYPLFGIQVMNASSCNPHAAYDFSFTPSSREEYEFYLKNLDLIPPIKNQDQIYEYYFMRHLLPLRNWLFPDDERYKKETGFGLNPMTRKIYDYYLFTENKTPLSKIQYAMKNFLRSDAYQLGRSHFETKIETSSDSV